MKIRAAIFHQSLHLGNDKLGLPEPECPLCGSTNRQSVYLLQEDPDVLLLACDNCHASSASRMPTDSALEEYYNTYYKSSYRSESGLKITFDDASRFGKYLANKFFQYQSKSHISILDFGGGDGSISHSVAVELLSRGMCKVDITVIDYNEDTVIPQDSRISITRENKLEDISSKYNVVIASAVIEHIPKPRGILDGLLNQLETGGIFYARTPYVVPLMRMSSRVGIKWDFTYPAHIHDLGQHFWEAYFDSIVSIRDFRILQSRPSIVETTFKEHFLKTVAAYSLKAPWYLIGGSYKLVGGWEVFVVKN
jgi:transcription elongation factor Elf1